MACDIHAYLEKQRDDGTYEYIDSVFNHLRDYNFFAFLADVRNYSNIEPLVPPRRNLPADVSEYVLAQRNEWGSDGHSTSWVSVDELFAFDYSSIVKQNTGYTTWGGITRGTSLDMKYSDFLGDDIMMIILRLGKFVDHRIVFWFDN